MRVKITDEEAASVGITISTPCDPHVVDGETKPGWGELVKPLLRAKGVSEDLLQPGDMRCIPVFRHPRDASAFPEMSPEIPGMVFFVQDQA
jgi:hypothetical protein